MSVFEQYKGEQIRITEDDRPLFLYVLNDGELDPEMMEELLGDLHPEGEIEDGLTVVAIEGEIYEGEADAGGFLALHAADDRVYLCDEGTIRFLDGKASDLTIEIEKD